MRLTPSGGRTAPGPADRFTLYVTDGIGCVATRGDGVREIRPGDVVVIEPGEDHWHGEVVTWLDHVTDDEYGAS